MLPIDPIIVLKAEQTKFVADAAAAWRTLKKGSELKAWMKIAAALTIGSEACLHATSTNNNQNPLYKRAFSQWCRDMGFADLPNYVRSRLLWLKEPQHEQVLWELHAQMSLAQQLRITHPDAWYKRVRAAIYSKPPKRPAERPGEPADYRDMEPEQVLAHCLATRPVEEIMRLLVDASNVERCHDAMKALKSRILDKRRFEQNK